VALEQARLREEAAERWRLEVVSRHKSEFLASMSHELRTPLNAIIGFSEIMEKGMFGKLGVDKYHEYCRDIHQSGQYLLDVINDVLDMSKIEAGRMKLEPEHVVLEDILSDSLRVVSTRAEEKGLTLSSRIASDIEIRADRRALKQIALNLLSNAVKFTGPSGHVAVRGRRVGGCVSIAISDSGIGIPKDALQRLGRPFEQVESQLTKVHHGSGLGLAIAKSLVALHGGRMRIRSTPGRGTTVIVRLPVAGPRADSTASAAA
jgi:two-component system cell cycle sensor histidine kinase PleC